MLSEIIRARMRVQENWRTPVRFASLVAGLVAAFLPLQSIAQTADGDASSFPSRPVRMIVPFPPGGPTDVTARLFAQKLGEQWGQAVVVENRPGGNSALGAQQAAKAAPDGYTILVVMDTTMVMNPITTSDLPYNAFKDFAPISMMGQNTSLLVVRAEDGPQTVQDLIARAKSSPGKMNYGAGTITTHLAGYLFARLAGIDAVYISYRGSAEVVQGVMNGSVGFSIDGVSANLPLIQQGKLLALAKLNNRPLASLPDLEPLAKAAGIPALGEISTWAGLVAPAGTPAPVVDKIQKAVAKAAADPDVMATLGNFGISAVASTPAEFERYYRSEYDRWSKIFQDSGIKLE
jgi:tripartite-type tricarboxylate transporter receptor subunit TctC